MIITALELRNRLAEIIDLVNSGTEVFIKYRGKPTVKLNATTKPQKTKGQQLLEYFSSPEYDEKIRLRQLNRPEIPELDEKNPRQEKMNMRQLRPAKYER